MKMRINKERNKPTNTFITNYKRPNRRSLRYIRKTFTHMYNVSEGSVRSGKTIDNLTSFCMNVDESVDALHLAIAPTYTSARATLFESSGIGIRHFPEWQERHERINGKLHYFPQRIFETTYEDQYALMLVPEVGSNKPVKYIVPFGGNNKSSHVGYRGWSVGMVIATEIDLLHPATMNELQSRTIASKNRKFFYDLNPNAPEHSVYKLMDNWKKSKGGFNYIHKTLIDNPIMTQDMIDIVVSEYDPESIDYKRYILGERVGAYGLIYKVRDYNIIDDDEINLSDYHSYIITADIGINHSATTFQLQAYNPITKSLDILKEYYHRNSDERNDRDIKLPVHYASDFITFIKEAREYMGYYPIRIQSDLDVTFQREFNRIKVDYSEGNLRLYNVVKDEISGRISTGINYLYTKRLRFAKSCVHTIKAFEMAQYDPKQEQRGVYVRYDVPNEGTVIDPIDTVEYGFKFYERELGR